MLLVARWLAEHHQKSSRVSAFACSSRRTCDHQKGFQLLSPIKGISGAAGKWSLLIRASELGKPGQTSGYDTSVSLDLVRHPFMFPVLPVAQRHTKRKKAPFSLLVHASDKRNGKRVETAPLSKTANHAIHPQTRRCERGSRCQRCQRQKSGRGAEARRLEELQQCTTLRKICPLVPGCVQDPSRASPARTGTRTRLGTSLEKALTRALTGSTLSVGRVFVCIFNEARPVGTSLNGHGCAVLFLDPSRGPACVVGQPGVASTVLG